MHNFTSTGFGCKNNTKQCSLDLDISCKNSSWQNIVISSWVGDEKFYDFASWKLFLKLVISLNYAICTVCMCTYIKLTPCIARPIMSLYYYCGLYVHKCFLSAFIETLAYVTGFWKTDQIITLGLFHFIGPANGYTCTLHIYRAVTRLG